MTIEHSTQDQRFYVIVENEAFKPEIVNSTANSPFSRFIGGEIERLNSHIADLKSRIPTREKKLRGRRSVRESEEVRESLEHQINHSQAILDALEGKTLQPLRLRKEGEQIVACELDSFKSEGEAEFWKFAQVNRDAIMSVANTFPKGIYWLSEAFSLRFLSVYGSTAEERSSARREYNSDFSKRYGELSEDQAYVLQPLISKITRMFAA